MTRPMRDVPTHYLRPNHESWTPPAVISFDTETVSKWDDDNEVMTLRLWCARFSDRRAPRRMAALHASDNGVFPEDMAHAIHHWTRRRKCVWAYAHNVGFDLRTTSLTENLMRIGWEVTEFAVNSSAPFIRMRDGDHNLTISDSWSWFGVGLEKVAEALGKHKLPLPDQDDTYEMWLARCQQDTDILHEAMLGLMDWWDDQDLGQWNITGSASGWNAMRHRPTPERILIGTDEAECDHDRRAIYGGRRSVWQTGQYHYGHYTEVDIEKAYTVACRDLPLPIGRQARFTSISNDHKWLDCDRWGVIAECIITTDTASVPVRTRNGVWYPVGTFVTTLAGPDIRECRSKGTLVSVGNGYLHKLGYPLRPWATWCIDALSDGNTQTPDLAKLVFRQWARSAVGKWNQRGFEVLHLGPSPNGGWNYEDAWHHGKNVPAGIVDFGGERYQVAAVNVSDNAYPAVLAFVESYVRVAIGRALAITTDKHMVACDTDGYICDIAGANRIAEVNQAIAPFTVRPKRHFNRIKVIGPQHMELDRIKRRSGIPASAEPQADGRLKAYIWPKLSWQLANGRPDAYVRPAQYYKLAATYAPGWVLSDGSVVPVEMAIDDAGCNYVVPYPRTRYATAQRALAEHQNRHLERYGHDDH